MWPIRLRLAGIAILLSCSQPSVSPAQPTPKPLRIGYTNLELVLSYMPEAQQVEQQLRSYERKVIEQLNIKQSYLQTKVEEYTELKQQGKLTAAQEEERRKEIMKLDEEIKRFQEESEQSYLKKKAELLQPIIEKLQKAITELATAEGYDYILNNSNATGVAFILHGPKADDVTDRLLRRLGIDTTRIQRPSGDTLKALPSTGATPGPGLPRR
ncbi:MAG: OmpH family outer membrane protein [Bacteroidia bacterium]|nr:OmpH family outer membrane protein [Bacteroidia bacterium]MDW8089426.1 OmpH family outer membrane protein [Bacteroidia bacterium]